MRIIPWIISVAGAGLVLYSTWNFGAGYTSDSVNYLACAHSLIAGEGFFQHDGTPFMGWPPLMPMIIALMGILGIDPTIAPMFLNALCLGLTVLAAHHILKRMLHDNVWVVFGILCLFMPPMAGMYLKAWSEPLYILLSMLFIIAFQGYLDRGSKRLLVTAAVLAALVSLQRYLGVSLIITGVVILMIRPGPENLGRRVRTCLVFGLIASIPLWIWMARNYAMASVLTGHRYPPNHDIGYTLFSFVYASSLWIYHEKLSRGIRLVLMAMTSGGLLWALWKSFNLDDFKTSFRQWTMPWTIGMYVTTYTALLFISYLGSYLDPMPHRYLGVVYFGFMFLIFLGLDRACCALSGSRGAVIKKAMIVTIGVWIGLGLSSTANSVHRASTHGPGDFASPNWERSGVLSWLHVNSPKIPIYSNCSEVIYLWNGLRINKIFRKEDSMAGLEADFAQHGEVLLIWIEKERESVKWQFEDMSGFGDLKPIASFPDGSIYGIQPKN